MKAVALVSGGLDSRLAAKSVREQGVEILPLAFSIPFSHKDKETFLGSPSKDELIERELGCSLKRIALGEDFLEIVKAPAHGYGANLNPCIDCKILMLLKAAEFMRDNAAAFIITGEVLGQRPMSQHRQALALIEKEAHLEGLVLRPLSAKLLAETIPEKEGWVRRDKLMGFCGRSRRPQMELARDLGVQDYPAPAGGCLLTDPEFSRKLKDLIAAAEFNPENIELLKAGRYFRINSAAILIVGRDEKENSRLAGLAREGDYLFYPGEELAGPTSLGRGNFGQESIELACRINCAYCDLSAAGEAEIFYKKVSAGKEESRRVTPIRRQELAEFRR